MSGIHMGLLASKPPGPGFLSSDTAVNGGTTVTVNKPTGVVAGTLLIAVMITATTAGPRTWTGDAGWGEQVDQGALPNFRIATLIAGAGEPATYTFTVSGAATILQVLILAFERATFDSIGILSPVVGATNCVAPSINFTLPGLVLGIFGNDNTGTFTTPAGMSLLVNSSRIYVFAQYSNIGATGTRTSVATCVDDNVSVLLGML